MPDGVRPSSGNARDVAVALARPDQTTVVSDILREAGAWLVQRGISLWRDDALLPEAIDADVRAGYYVLASRGTLPVGALRFTLEDNDFWPDAVADEAAYVHRLAVRRAYAGGVVSAALLDWSAARAASLSRRFPRLDCDATRPRLVAFYERHGFTVHTKRSFGPFLVTRYEKTLTV